jgi:hypothetical protein
VAEMSRAGEDHRQTAVVGRLNHLGGLAKIYQNHLDRVNKMAGDAGLDVDTVLMDGKPYDKILSYIKKENPSTLILGRTGVHNTNGLDIGSTTENLLRLAPCNILLTGGSLEAKLDMTIDYAEFQVPSDKKETMANSRESLLNENGFLRAVKSDQKTCDKPSMLKQVPFWTQEAQIQAEKIPSFIRGVVKRKIEEYAQEKGCQEITMQIVTEAKALFMGDDSLHHIQAKRNST